jgi:hypothetical protein
MRSAIKNTSISFMVTFSVFMAFIFVLDAFKFHDNDYSTPWYDVSIMSPYTNLFLKAFGQKKEYWKKNAVGNELWLVRDVSYKDQTYWTILERKEI